MADLLKAADGNPVLRGSDEIFTSSFGNVLKGVDKKSRTLTIVGSDETVDRDGDIIAMTGWMLDNYLKNPVFLWAHDYKSVPIGSTVRLTKRRNPSHLEFQVKFPTQGLFPFADLIFDLYSDKFINACSVGFIPKEWEPIDEKDQGVGWGGRKFTKQELLELSGCPVPSNPSALQNALKSMDTSWTDILNLQQVLLEKGVADINPALQKLVGEFKFEIPKPAEYVEDLMVQVAIDLKGEVKCEGQENQENPAELQDENCKSEEVIDSVGVKSDDSESNRLEYNDLLEKVKVLEVKFTELERSYNSLDRKVIELLAEKSNLVEHVNENEEEVVLQAFKEIKSILGGIK